MLDFAVTLDTNGNGIDDALQGWNGDQLVTMYDTNEDGIYDANEVTSGLTMWGGEVSQEFHQDSDYNGIIDRDVFIECDERGNTVSWIECNDYDQDGTADMVKEFYDTDGDGKFDLVATMHADNSGSDVLVKGEIHYDANGDGTPEETMHIEQIDSDHDGIADKSHVITENADGIHEEWIDITEEGTMPWNGQEYHGSILGSSIAAQFNPSTDPAFVTGTPAEDMKHWEFQGDTGRCAIYSQKFVIEAILGTEIPIEELVRVAEENGWFYEDLNSGTSTLNMDKLLDYYNINHEMSFDNNIEAIEEAFNNGHKVIVGVDSGQIWYGDDNNIFSPMTVADHAVEVIGFDYSDPNNPMVILNDSGSPDGCGELVPLDVFINAWEAGDCQMIECWA